jgi:integrase
MTSKTDYFKTKSRKISIDNKKFIEEYLIRVSKRSYKTARAQKIVIEKSIEYIDKPIHLINKQDVLDFIQEKIENNSNLSLVSKETYIRNLKAFFDSMVFLNQLEYNPVPSIKMLKQQGLLNQNELKGKAENPFKEDELDIYKREELLEILQLSRGKKLTDFIIFGLLISTGARISEILTIRTNHVDLERSMIYTGEVNGARKSTLTNRNNKGPIGIFFCFPENFGHYIKQFIQIKGRKNDEFLFQGTKFDDVAKEFLPYPDTTFRTNVKYRYGSKWTTFHKFRRTVITCRVKDKKCPLEISKLLVNHKTTDIEMNHYIKLTLEDRINLYKTYFPFESLPYF